MSNVEGKATAITVMSPIWPGARHLLRALFAIARHPVGKRGQGKLETLSFIHYARWAVISEFPNGDRGEKLKYSYLFFESNFNGTWDEYIDAFSEVVPVRMWAIWFTSFGFPGPQPVAPFKRYIRKNEYIANHYWSAYPEAATTEVNSAGRVAEAVTALRRKAEGMDRESFKKAYDEMLMSIQHDF
jgi:hypothetical protein